TVFNRVSRFTANGDVAVAGSELVLFDGEPLDDKTMHYGGGLWFGGDGKLYMTTGDRQLGLNAQSLSTTWGKILRINPNGTIPTDNPFYSQTTGRNRAIWALGLRNPWQVAKDGATGRVFISDVGQSTWEELNEPKRAANYGWPKYEGSSGGATGYTDPVWQYNHSTGTPTGCAIMGGDFYNPAVAQLPAQFVGTFIVADHCEGWVKSVDFAHGNVVRDLFTGLEQPVSIKIGSQGQIYYLQRMLNGVSGGGLFRVDFTGGSPLSITQQPQNQTTAIGGSATFSVSATGGTGPIKYQWQRNGASIAGATSSTYTLTNAQPGDSGARFRARVSDGTTSLTSRAATLTVTTNHVPVATIVTPEAGATYAAGNTLSYSGTGTDQEDGNEPRSRFTWEVVFHHNTHTHDFILPYSGAKAGSFVVPNDNETDADVWYRIHLTVTDSQGASTSVFRDVLPRTSVVTLQTSPAGLQLTLDGTQFTSPTTFTGVEGIVRRIGAPSPQALGPTTWRFASWSDGGGATHTITTPVKNKTYTATFTQAAAP
ncbi:MAG: PQQ-dependent sugar dehydrogenase, partial [Actinomycetota bacterium]|nr:PQQ-dependent sugar dehydrogenase [Actinomycetota bacterium]